MLIVVLILIILNIIFTINYLSIEEKNKKWLEKAKEAYDKQEFISEYPKSEIAIKKINYKYNVVPRFLISSWFILLICPFFLETKILLIVYIINFMYSRLLNHLCVIEQKIDVIKNEVYKENEYL